MNNKINNYTFLKEKLDDNALKLYCFRIDDDENYECEEYIYKNKHVLDLKYGQSSKSYFNEVMSKENTTGLNPSVYFDYKKMGFQAFGEDLTVE